MPPKKQTNQGSQPEKKSAGICAPQGPGPIYKLKPLVGFKDHCHSRYRNPAYSIIGKIGKQRITSGPGPKYQPKFPPTQGFSFGMALKTIRRDFTPGPYNVATPSPRPAFSMKWRTKQRSGSLTPAPYSIPRDLNGPAFTMGMRLQRGRCDTGPGPRPISLNLVKPSAPAFSFRTRPPATAKHASPGPYDPVILTKAPAFSFGLKHSPCAPPLISACDKIC